MADQGIPQAVDAGVRRRPGWHWIVLFGGIAVLIAAVPFVFALNEWAWNWLLSRYAATIKPAFMWRTTTAYQFLWPQPGLRFGLEIFRFSVPALILLLGFLRRWTTGKVVGIQLAAPFVFFALLSIVVSLNQLHEGTLTLCLLYALLGALVSAVVMTLTGFPQYDAEALSRDLHPSNAGVTRHPWRTWIILAAAFIALQLSVALSGFINEELWHILTYLDVPERPKKYPQPLIYTDEFKYYDYYAEAVRYSVKNFITYVMPFVFLVLAVYLRMRPIYGILLGVLVAVSLAAEMVLAERMYDLYSQLSGFLIAGQLCGLINYIALRAYHREVSKIQFEPEED